MVSAGASDLLFTFPKGKCITYPALQKKLKSLIVEIGLDPNEYSTHSFRRGGTTTAFKAKVPIVLIKAHGDWKTDRFQKYVSLFRR